MYSECDSNDLNASFEKGKGKGDTEGAISSLENDDNLDSFFDVAQNYQQRKT